MDFFDKLGKKATEAYKITADKTGKLAKETKLKFKMSDLKSQIEELYEEIGKKVYEKHIREEEISIKKDLEEQCIKIDVLANEIEDIQNEALELKDKKQCKNCYTQIDKEDNYCKNCGAKQNDIEINDKMSQKEKYMKDNLEKKKEVNKDDRKIEEDLAEIDENRQYKKTENNQYEKEQNNDDIEKINEEEQTNLEKTVQIESNNQ